MDRTKRDGIDSAPIANGEKTDLPAVAKVGSIATRQEPVQGRNRVRDSHGWNRGAALALAQEGDQHGWQGHAGCLGVPGVGKSYLMKEIIAKRPRVVVIDSEFQYGSGHRQNPLPGFTVVHQPGQLKEILRKNLGGNFRVIYQPHYEPEKHFDAIIALVTESEDVTLGIEEAANYCSAGSAPKGFDYLLRCGRHRGISIVWNSQRPADVARKLTSPSRLFVFRLEESVDRDFCIARGMSKELAAIVSSLPERQFVCKNREGQWVTVK